MSRVSKLILSRSTMSRVSQLILSRATCKSTNPEETYFSLFIWSGKKIIQYITSDGIYKSTHDSIKKINIRK